MAERVISRLKETLQGTDASQATHVHATLRQTLLEILTPRQPLSSWPKPFVVLVVGVNGVGKTTSIASSRSDWSKVSASRCSSRPIPFVPPRLTSSSMGRSDRYRDDPPSAWRGSGGSGLRRDCRGQSSTGRCCLDRYGWPSACEVHLMDELGRSKSDRAGLARRAA